jgi:hypothetical protein
MNIGNLIYLYIGLAIGIVIGMGLFGLFALNQRAEKNANDQAMEHFLQRRWRVANSINHPSFWKEEAGLIHRIAALYAEDGEFNIASTLAEMAGLASIRGELRQAEILMEAE